MKSEWKDFYNQCNESNEPAYDFKYYSVNSKKNKIKSTRKSKWREIESIKDQQRLRSELMDLLDYY